MDTRGSDRPVAARYRLHEQLGAGGMGVVWRATDELLHVEVAIKQVSIGHWLPEAEREQRVARAMREARNAARLREHPNIVTVHDVVVEHGVPWIVMEYVPSRTLAEVVDADGPLSVEQVRVLGTALVDALATAHALGIVHRDVKPANVLFASTGRIALVDFGIAVHEDDAGLTGTGVIGTLEYIAPERLRGDPATPAADLFSLGCTLFQAIEGVSPFRRGQAYASMAAVLGEPPPRPVRAGPLAEPILGLLAKDPAGRPAADRLRELLAANVTDGGARDLARRSAAPTELARSTGVESAAEESASVEPPAPTRPASPPPPPPVSIPPASVPGESAGTPLPGAPTGPADPPGGRRPVHILAAVVGVVAVLVLVVLVSLLSNGSKGSGKGRDTPAEVSSESVGEGTTDGSSEADSTAPSDDSPAPPAAPEPTSAATTTG